MKIAAWNVNSVRARLDRLVDWLKSAQPDVVCLQELKCVDADFPREAILAAGYHAAVHGQKTYNGVAILAKTEPTDVVVGLSDGVDDTHARVISATVDGVRVISVYAPNGQEVESDAYKYKLEFYARLRRYLDARHKPGEPLALCGDWNVAPEPIDVWDVAVWEGQTLFTLKERAAWKTLCDFGLTDTFRAMHPDVKKFSWWDYRMLQFQKNQGVRIDHVLTSAPLTQRLVAADVDREARKGKQPSDHAPVWAEFKA
ncbi:exodeoxyribonuclease III [Melittangium boletus]|uniref:Exodeoxyribonuclease III n=1 Tax=Melittangium boletus DSM 14713 TaxID=1294270 RepID=A0A250IJU8_9BACT|nr:exodeoxyribonuclease III [Melittangium boletus]ATB32074.1 exodeoxyribonuclease III [Melittangium boletus DSM 14713]